MKIIEIIPQLSSGGGERFTVDLCNELITKGHEVTIVVLLSLNDNTNFYIHDLSPDVKVVSMNKKVGLDLDIINRLRNFIKSQSPHIVHTHLRAISYVLPCAMLNRKTKFFHTIHSAAQQEAGGGFGAIVRKIAFKLHYITPVTISEDSHRSFLDFYKKDAPMIVNGRNIPNHVEVSESVKQEIRQYKKSKNTRILIQLASIYEVKRQDLMARVCKKLSDEGFDFSLLMIGRTPDIEFRKRVEKIYSPDVHLIGERRQVLEYLTESDAYCLCSSYEGMPISLIEALGCYTIPICTPVGGIVNTIRNGVNGFLSKDIEEESYYQTLKHFLLLNDEDLSAIKIKARESYQPYSMTDCASKYINLFNGKKQ